MQLLVRSSILGADRDTPAEFISAHTTCDRYLEASGLPYVIVRPNLFLQNVPESTIPSIDESGTFYADAGQARIAMVDTRDVAAVAAVAPAATPPRSTALLPNSPGGRRGHWTTCSGRSRRCQRDRAEAGPGAEAGVRVRVKGYSRITRSVLSV